MRNHEISKVPEVLEGSVDPRWANNTIYNHYEDPLQFMDDVVASNMEGLTSDTRDQIRDGMKAYDDIASKDVTYDKLYQDVARKVKDKLKARGFTTAMLYSSVEFSTENTGALSKQRAMMGRRDCYFKNPAMTDGKLFHDIYINLSYPWTIADSTIMNNSYAIYALTKELARLIPIRVIVVNHVGTDTPTCYSYVLKKFGLPLDPGQFLFFTAESKRTFGWATYKILNGGKNSASVVGRPEGSVSIAAFDLDIEIGHIFEKVMTQAPELFKRGA